MAQDLLETSSKGLLVDINITSRQLLLLSHMLARGEVGPCDESRGIFINSRLYISTGHDALDMLILRGIGMIFNRYCHYRFIYIVEILL